VGGARSKTAFFALLWVPFDYPAECGQSTGNSFTPDKWYRWKAETLKVCLLLVWRVCDKAFGRYLADAWQRKVTRPSGKFKKYILHIDTRRKIHRFKKCYSFRSATKSNEVIAEKKPFQNSGVTRRLAVLNY